MRHGGRVDETQNTQFQSCAAGEVQPLPGMPVREA
jgi:hypothetical protein